MHRKYSYLMLLGAVLYYKPAMALDSFVGLGRILRDVWLVLQQLHRNIQGVYHQYAESDSHSMSRRQEDFAVAGKAQ